MSGLDTIVVGGLVVGGLFVTAVAIGGRFEDAANDASDTWYGLATCGREDHAAAAVRRHLEALAAGDEPGEFW